MAVHRRRRGVNPPHQSDHRGKKRNSSSGKSCQAIFGTNFGIPPNPPPLSEGAGTVLPDLHLTQQMRTLRRSRRPGYCKQQTAREYTAISHHIRCVCPHEPLSLECRLRLQPSL